MIQKIKSIILVSGIFLICTTALFAQKHNDLPKEASNNQVDLMYDKVMNALGEGDMGLAMRRIDTMEMIATADQDYHNIGFAQNSRAEFLKMKRDLKAAKLNYKNALSSYLRSESTGEIFVQYYALGDLFILEGQLDSALYYLDKTDAYEDSYRREGFYNKGTQHNSKARVYSAQGRFDLSIKSYLIAIEAASGDRAEQLPRLYSNLAAEYLRLYNYEQAEFYTNKSYELVKAEKKPILIGVSLALKSILAMHQKDFQQAEKYALESLKIAESENDRKRVAYRKSILAKIYFKQKKYSEAENILASINESDFDKTSSAYTQHLINLIEQGLYKDELGALPPYFERAMSSAIKQDNRFNQQVISNLKAKYYGKKKQYKEQAQALVKSQSLKDSLFNIQRASIASSLTVQYETEKKEQMIAQLEFEDEVKRNQLSTQRWIIGTALGGLALLGSLLFLLFRRNDKIKNQNAIIEKALSEKDLLLREIHHRVKNNLQMVSSLLGLQGMNTVDKEVKEAINAGKSRVMSMALIHQDLYNKENLTSVNVKEYLEKLCKELVATYQIDKNKIHLKTDIQDLELDVETLIPLGLIINELMTNAIKYAFLDQEKGEIFVRLFEENGRLFLDVKDNGIGIADGKQSSNSFGFKLVNSLLRQLDGEMKQEQQEGTHFELKFKEYRKMA